MTGLSVVTAHGTHVAHKTGTGPGYGDTVMAYSPTTDPHPELVGTTSISTIPGKISEVCVKGKILDVTIKSTNSVFKMVTAEWDGKES